MGRLRKPWVEHSLLKESKPVSSPIGWLSDGLLCSSRWTLFGFDGSRAELPLGSVDIGEFEREPSAALCKAVGVSRASSPGPAGAVFESLP